MFKSLALITLLSIFTLLPLQAKEFIVGINPWLNFIYYEDDKPKGHSIELLKYIAKEMNYKIKFQQIPWSRSLAMLKSGEIDAMANLSYSKSRENFLHFLQPPYYEQKMLFYTTKDKADTIKTYEDLYRYIIPVGKSYVYFDRFDNDEKMKKFVVSYESSDEKRTTPEDVIINMLIKGHIEIMLTSSGVMEYLIKKHDIKKDIIPTKYDPQVSDGIYLGISKKSPFVKDLEKINTLIKNYINK